MAEIMLTALVVTYNHEKFVEEALRGVLMQHTDFDYEVIVSDDCSTDQTRALVERIAREYPERVRLMLSERNLNDNTVTRRGVEAARGRYLAVLDGDDVWTDPAKLQKQVDFLEARPDCSMSFHNARVVYDDRSAPSHPYLQDEPTPGTVSVRTPKALSTLEDVLERSFIPTCSAVYRTEHMRGMPDWYDDHPVGDYPMHVFSAQHGYVAYLNDVMADYRIHAGGVWTNLSKYEHLDDVEAVVEISDTANSYLGGHYDHIVDPGIANFYARRAAAFYRAGKYDWASTCARRALARLPFRQRLRRRRLLALVLVSTVRARVPRTR